MSAELDLSFLPLTTGGVTLVAWDGASYVADDGRTFWTASDTPSADDAAAAVANPQNPPSPVAPVPTVVGSGQIRAALIACGVAADDDALNALVEAALAGAIADTTQRAIALTLWRNASEFVRGNAFIATAKGALGLSDEQVDDLFRLAATF